MANVVLAPVHTRLLKSWTVLGHSGVAVPLTGSTSETTLATIAVPANTMGPNGALRIWTLWSYTNSAGNKTMRHKYGGTSFGGSVPSTTASTQCLIFIRNRNATNSQIGMQNNAASFSPSTQTLNTGAIDSTAAQNVTITGQLASGADSMTLEGYTVEAYYSA